jgi:hypothetical protein
MIEAAPKIPAPARNTEKLILPTDEETKLDKNQLILMGLGYASLVFLALAIFFPYWNDFLALPPQSISLWQRTVSPGVLLFHWEVIWYWPIYGFEIILSIVVLSALIPMIILLIRHIWKRTFPGSGFFTVSILLGIVCGLGFPLFSSFDFGTPYGYAFATPIYGPGWGLAFGWWALLISGFLGLIRKKYAEMLEREKKEKEESF